jgi:hypothetical protein
VPSRRALSTEDVRALWAFIGSGLGASVTLVGLLLSRSHNERTLALQAEAERRLALDTVVKRPRSGGRRRGVRAQGEDRRRSGSPRASQSPGDRHANARSRLGGQCY